MKTQTPLSSEARTWTVKDGDDYCVGEVINVA